MGWLAGVLGLIVALVVLFVLVRLAATVRGSNRVHQAVVDQVAPVVLALQRGENPSEEIERLAARRETRSTLYRALREEGFADRFPPGYAQPAAIAESDLCLWLLHPNELGVVPDEIEMAEEFQRTVDDPPVKLRFFVFRFRTHPPQWAAKDGWMAGVAGPYWDGEDASSAPPCVFSRFEAFDSRTPDEHLQAAEDLVLRKLKR